MTVWVAMGSDILIGKAISIQCAYFSSITQNKAKSKVEQIMGIAVITVK